MKIDRIDHLNLTVADIDRSVEFYRRVLGMQSRSMGEGRAALISGSRRSISTSPGVRWQERRKAHAGAYLFVTEAPLGEIKAHLDNCGVPVRMEGPRAGAIGTIQSVYIDDPDQNSIEISIY